MIGKESISANSLNVSSAALLSDKTDRHRRVVFTNAAKINMPSGKMAACQKQIQITQGIYDSMHLCAKQKILIKIKDARLDHQRGKVQGLLHVNWLIHSLYVCFNQWFSKVFMSRTPKKTQIRPSDENSASWCFIKPDHLKFAANFTIF